MDKAIWSVKNKVVPVHTKKANGGMDGAEWSANMPQTFSLVPTTPQVGGAPEQVQTFGSGLKKRLLPLPEIEPWFLGLVTIPIKLSCHQQEINEQTHGT
jgi:hypothetical protein